MAVTKGLSDPNRVRIVLALGRGEVCVCQITKLLGFAPSTISRHLSILYHAGLVRSPKSERWVYYRLPDKSAPVTAREALAWVYKSLGGSLMAVADETRLKQILMADSGELCRRQYR